MLITVLIFLGVLAVIIIAHELGHFMTAKASGVEVKEFGVGLPPRLFSVKRGETIYSLNAIPLGGFTKMSGEEDPAAPRSLAGKPFGIRLLVLSAGSLMNFLLPLILFAIAFMVPHNMVIGEVLVEDVAPGSPAALAGIEPGDRIVSINGKPLDNSSDLQRYIQISLGREIVVRVEHSDLTVEDVNMVPRWRPPEGQGAVGIVISMPEATVVRRSEPFWRVPSLAASACVETMVLFKNGILSMLAGTTSLSLTGPVGIAQMTGEAAKVGISPLLEFAAFLSLNIGLINLFPLPALDGGRIGFLMLEKVRRGRRVSPKTEGMVHLIGFLLLMGVFAAVTYNDILRIVSGGSLTP
ncbi:MAG: site-2 protease family protein [Dehalococcoidales bacterium]|nr:site-2 protease family protein [Dehalococcoidales bacterium]